MSIEHPRVNPAEDSPLESTVQIEPGYEGFIPTEFNQDPIGYFEREGKNIKPGEIKYDDKGEIRDDPTAVKELPLWFDQTGKQLRVIGKRVDKTKGEVKKSEDPFHEYRVMGAVHSVGLPAAKPVARIEQGKTHLLLTEKINGIGWYEKNKLRENGYTDTDIGNLKQGAEDMMKRLEVQFLEAGISRGWKLKDMIFDLDLDTKTLKGLIPTDWERTTIDNLKLTEYQKTLNEKGKSND